MRQLLYLLFLLFFFSSCEKERRLPVKSYLKWVNEPENGLVKTKYVNGLELKIKYLSPEYLAWRELSDKPGNSVMEKDSLLHRYRQSLSFLLSIGPDERKKSGSDIMMQDISNYKEYTERSLTMNFDMEQYIRLKAGKSEYRPVLSALENTYGLSSGRNILLVFTPLATGDQTFKQSGELDFIYADELFGLGTNHFVFTKKELSSIPELIF